MQSPAIPLIDLTDALAPGAPRTAEVASTIRGAATTSGFFYVKNHGVPLDLIDEQFQITREFFDLPLEDKNSVTLKNSTSAHGWESLGTQTLDASAKPDLKESFYAGVEYAEDHPYVLKKYHNYGPNQWPETLPAMQAQCTQYIAAMRKLAERMMQLLAVSLGLPEAYFGMVHDSPMATLRLLRYPPHPEGADELTFGAGAHTDWGAVTLLAQDKHGGLEVAMPDGTWVPATPIPGTFVVNLGDMIPRWTNGRYHSNPHRVRNVSSGGAPRYSIPFFYNPDFEAVVSPVSTCVSEEDPARFEPCTVGEHLAEMYRKTYGIAA